jgi:hypothetical protein
MTRRESRFISKKLGSLKVHFSGFWRGKDELEGVGHDSDLYLAAALEGENPVVDQEIAGAGDEFDPATAAHRQIGGLGFAGEEILEFFLQGDALSRDDADEIERAIRRVGGWGEAEAGTNPVDIHRLQEDNLAGGVATVDRELRRPGADFVGEGGDEAAVAVELVGGGAEVA